MGASLNYSTWGVSWLGSWGNSWGPLHVVEEDQLVLVHGWIGNTGSFKKAKTRKREDYKHLEQDQPTPEQIEAERIRLGIVEAKKEVVRVKNKKKDAPVEVKPEYDLHIALVQQELARLEAEYAIFRAQLASRGLRIRGEVIYRAALAAIDAQFREEADIAFVVAVLSDA